MTIIKQETEILHKEEEIMQKNQMESLELKNAIMRDVHWRGSIADMRQWKNW